MFCEYDTPMSPYLTSVIKSGVFLFITNKISEMLPAPAGFGDVKLSSAENPSLTDPTWYTYSVSGTSPVTLHTCVIVFLWKYGPCV